MKTILRDIFILLFVLVTVFFGSQVIALYVITPSDVLSRTLIMEEKIDQVTSSVSQIERGTDTQQLEEEVAVLSDTVAQLVMVVRELTEIQKTGLE